MDAFSAVLEDMATRFEAASESEPSIRTIERWKDLFGNPDPYSTIIQFREDLNRPSVSDDHWKLVRNEKEAAGHDRESYEYSLTLRNPAKSKTVVAAKGAAARGQYLLQLQPACVAIASPKAVQSVLELELVPKLEKADDGSEFVRLSSSAKSDIERILHEHCPSIRPLFIRLILPAAKALHHDSMHPALGIDSTLPQYRLTNASNLVQQEQYPVWYFFYGTLGDATILRRILGRDEDCTIAYNAATVDLAALTTWGGKYLGLVDGHGVVEGSAYLVENEADELRLRHYETDHYEVVRCEIKLVSGAQQGLTFRFADREVE